MLIHMEDPDRLEDIHRSVASCTVLVYPVVSKNARSALFTVGTRTDLSKYLLPRSQEVSGKRKLFSELLLLACLLD